MNKIIEFAKENTVLVISFALAVGSAFIVPPSMDYFGYVDWGVIILLLCLMAVVAGLRSLGVFAKLSKTLLSKTSSSRMIAFILMNLCFFVSMLVTNDVALITFVPLTVGIFSGGGMSYNLMITVIIETAAANLGSMVTPIGNPQNLFLYKHYEMSAGDFVSTMLPLGAVSYVILAASVLLVKRCEVKCDADEEQPLHSGVRLWLYIAVFAVCVLSVAGVVHEYVCLAVTVAVIAAADYRLLARIDYGLLATFICFFVFVGNVGSIGAVRDFISSVITGNELPVAAALSQVISNVPAALMLADFTEEASALMRGVNLGGLGTPVASLASLISYRYYSSAENAQKGRYMGLFLVYNFAALAVMLAVELLLP